MQLIDVLQQKFGYHAFRPGQQEVIEQLLAGRDVIALLPTGMGKSICYQLPAYVMDKPVLIISPLLSLMQDQVDQLKQFGEKRVVALNSFLTHDQKQRALHQLSQYRFIFTSPEMLLQPAVRAKLITVDFGLIVADEAHCISQWGFDFRPDYLRIHEFIAATNRPPILALSATATETVVQDIKKYLAMREPFDYMHSVDRRNIHLAVISLAEREDKLRWILDHVTTTEGPGIIYTQSRMKAEAISLALLERGIAASSYHAGKESEDRQFIQQQFIAGELDWVVATNAFGMGVHKSNIRQVIHESMPSTVANYMQEIGRAGRDGESALATLLYVEGDEQHAKFVVTDDLPRELHVDHYLQYISRGEQPRQMIMNGEISETAFRVIDYWLAQENVEQVKKRLAHMQVQKMSAVEEMTALLKMNSCIREKIVRYFGQQLEGEIESCCTYCGLRIEEVVQPIKEKTKATGFISWQDRLACLLL